MVDVLIVELAPGNSSDYESVVSNKVLELAFFSENGPYEVGVNSLDLEIVVEDLEVSLPHGLDLLHKFLGFKQRVVKLVHIDVIFDQD